MHPEFKQPSSSGFSLPVVIFILVVIAVLAGAMARLMGGGGLSTAFEVQSTRAYLAARSGLEWAANATLSSPGSACFSPTQISKTDFQNIGITDCNASLSCENIAPNNPPNQLQRRDGTCADPTYEYGTHNCTVSLFLLSSNATCGTGPAQAQRNLQWLVGKESRYP